MRSLTLKLTLAFLMVGLVGSIVVALLVRAQTQREFDRFVLDQYGDSVTELTDYYEEHGTWHGVDAVVDPQPEAPYGGGRGHHSAFTVVDVERRIVSGNYIGKTISFRESDAVPLKVDGETVGWMVLYRPNGGRDSNSPEDDFLARMNFNILISASTASALALVVGVLLARTISHPIRDLRAATQKVAGGDLGYQVPVRTKDELGQLAESFNHMSADLAHANDLRRQMTADVAHELRNPLSVILGYTEALSEGKLRGEPPMFGVMHDEALHLQRLIEDLRTLSLADAGELSLLKQQVAPASLLERVAVAHAPHAQVKQVSLEVQADRNLPEITVDPDRIVQVLGNLVTNALRYTPVKGRIQLAAERVSEGLIFRVSDTGAGIAADSLPFIFERFYRADKSRQQNQGESGLGLAIAKSIVEAHGGSIAVESTPGKGTTFTIALGTA